MVPAMLKPTPNVRSKLEVGTANSTGVLFIRRARIIGNVRA